MRYPNPTPNTRNERPRQHAHMPMLMPMPGTPPPNPVRHPASGQEQSRPLPQRVYYPFFFVWSILSEYPFYCRFRLLLGDCASHPGSTLSGEKRQVQVLGILEVLDHFSFPGPASTNTMFTTFHPDSKALASVQCSPLSPA